MNICYLADAGSVHTKKFCKYFSEKGHKVSVISLRDGRIDGAEVYSLGFDDSIFASESTFTKLKYLTKFRKVRKTIKKIKPDIVHAHYATSYGMLAALSGVRPYILSVWGSDVYEFPSNLIKTAMLKYSLKCAAGLFSTSCAMLNQTKKFTSKDIFITPFGVNVDVFTPKDIDENDDKKIIGCVKKLEPIYGINYLLEAFARLSGEFDDVELHIAGKGGQEEELKNLADELGISEKVKWLGFVSPESEVVKTFQTFYAAAVPSVAESFGVSAIEAQSCGVPVVASNVGGLPETVIDGKTGFLAESQNSEDLYEKLKEIVKDRDLRNKMGHAGREFVCLEYDLDENFARIEEYYKNFKR